jgi:hypothetical protein
MLSGYKTYITAFIAVVTAVGGYLAGDATIAQTAQLCFTALLAAFVRNGVASSK